MAERADNIEEGERGGKPGGPDAIASTFGFDSSEQWVKLVQQATAARPRTQEMLGAYRVLMHAGMGSQGTVYKVVQPVTGRAIALKRLALGSFATTRDRVRFQRELAATASLNHPGIVTLLGHDEIDGQPVLLMEWVEGQPVHLWAQRASQREVLALFAKLCDAVAHAHRRGVLHRDLKPSNVLVVKGAESGEAEHERRAEPLSPSEPKVLDFGLSRLVAGSLAEAGRSGEAALHSVQSMTEGFVGTPAYASPEQAGARWGEVDTRSDVYAIGVMLYEALTGQRPFASDNLGALLTDISHKAPVRPSRVVRLRGRRKSEKIDTELDAIVLKAIAKQPAARYQSADAFASDLRRKLAGQAVHAHPPKLLYQSRALARQHRVAVALGAIALGALATLAVVSTTLASRLAARSTQLAIAVRAQQVATSEAMQKASLAESAAVALLASLGEVVRQSSEAGNVAPRELTDGVRARLEAGEFAALPEVEVSLWTTLATLAFSGRDAPLAAAFVERASAVVERTSEASAARGDYLNVVGLLHESKGEMAQAAWHYDQALCLIEPRLGLLHPQTLRVMANLAGAESLLSSARSLGARERAVRRAAELLERRILAHGPDAIETASAWALLSTVQRRAGKHELSRAALDNAMRTVDWSTQGRRSEAQRVARELQRRANVERDAATQEWALRQIVQAEVLPKGLGTKVWGTTRCTLAELLRAQGRLDEALALAREAHEANVRAGGKGHAERARSAVVLSECLGAKTREDASVAVLAVREARNALEEVDAMERVDASLRARAERVAAELVEERD